MPLIATVQGYLKPRSNQLKYSVTLYPALPFSYGELNCDRLHILITFIYIITPLLTSTQKPVLARGYGPLVLQIASCPSFMDLQNCNTSAIGNLWLFVFSTQQHKRYH